MTKGGMPQVKRFLGFVLSAIILLSVLTVGVSADDLPVTSDNAIALLKAEEGFSSKPYWDYAQWTVGYGTKCPDDMLEYYKQYGITEAEAESLLRTYLTRFENELHKFMGRTGVQLNQNQFDALLLFTYNCGSGWSYETSSLFYNAIVSGATGNDLIYAFSRWCTAGGQILTALLRRRLCEANIYLNGEYSQTMPDHYGYVLYDACGGKTSPTVQGYDTTLTAEILSKPSKDGDTFLGWYTAPSGGTEVKRLDAAVRNSRLYARWENSSATDTPVQPQGVEITVTGSSVNIRSGPGTNYAVVSGATKGDKLSVTETAEGTGYTWGKTALGWICLTYTDYDKVVAEQTPPDSTEPPEATQPPTQPPVEEKPETPVPQMGTVKVSDSLRIRSGPSTGHDVVGHLSNGERVQILEQQILGSMVWGRIDKGWISLDYVELDKVETPPENNPEDAPEPVMSGTVKVNEFLRIRSGPGTSYPVAGYLTNGTKVSILEKKESETMTWGKISDGWISLDYVVPDKAEEAPNQPLAGKVKVSDLLRVRSHAGTSYAIVAYLTNGTAVEILETKDVGATKWGRISQGWISMDYVELQGESQSNANVTKTVTASCLRIRKEPGVSYTIVGYLYTGAKVQILETKTVSGTQWGRTAKGWISMDYVK